jgi:dihydroneopterin aldolase
LDKITLKALKFHAPHGYYDNERIDGNAFEVDVIAFGDFRKAVSDDDLELTFNYERVQKVAEEVMNGPSEKLIETLCYLIGEKLFKQSSSLSKLNVSVRKMNPPIKTAVEYAEITMKWKR